MMLYVFGVPFLLAGAYCLISTIYFRIFCNEETTGLLVELEEHIDYDRYMPKTKCYTPVYRYEVDGKEYKYSPKKYVTNPKLYEIGTEVSVKYASSNPEICLINNSGDKLGIAIICLVLGAFLCFAAAQY